MKQKQLLLATLLFSVAMVFAQKKDKPNILIIMGDDIGYWNLSYNNHGMMGFKTPNIDKLAKSGTTFTDYYAEQSCTAGRSTLITGQMSVRTGMSKVGAPGADLGIQPEDPTLAELLKPLGYATGQFGKNHLGDKDEFLPTNHGFDEFYGNLYHLNAEETPENPDYPKNPKFREKLGPRGVIKSSADGRIEDTGPLTIKRMETVDDEFLGAATNFIEKNSKANKPFFCWFNSTRMHYFTHVSDEYKGKSGLNFYADGMMQHDDDIGVLLDKLEELGELENTIIIYTTDNGPHFNMWPDGGITPFRSEKNTNWEGGFRVPAIVSWPGKIKADNVVNEITSGLDWVPTLMAAAGEPNIKQKLLNGYRGEKRTFNVHLDGYNILPFLTGEKQVSRNQYNESNWPRQDFYYWSDDGDLLAMRHDRWKVVFKEQTAERMRVWAQPFVNLRMPLIFDMRMDPFEKAQHNSNSYWEWNERHVQFIAIAAQVLAKDMVQTFQKYPPRQKPASFNLDGIMESFDKAGKGN